MVLSISYIHASLTDVYKKGIIKLTPDNEFGKNTDWESIFFYSASSLLVASDDNIFIAYGKTSNIFKFNSKGEKVGVYSRFGRGPSDTDGPYFSSTLDDKYLVVGEYAENHRISIFDFAGKFINVIRTKTESSNVLGLKNGNICYSSLDFIPATQNNKKIASIKIHIINMYSKSEIQFPFGEYEMRVIKLEGGGILIPGNFISDIIMRKTKNGNLLLSIFNSPDISIYSPEGKLINRFQLNYKPYPVTQKFIDRLKEEIINSPMHGLKDPEFAKKIRKAREKADYSFFFNKYLPYYKDIIVDSDGNFLVFKWTDSFDTSKEVFQVYSPEGKYICETTLEKGMFNLEIDCHVALIQFTSTGIYAFVSYEGDEDTAYKIIKVKL